jgi:GTP-binding protein
MPGLDYAPVAFTTASHARNVQSVIDLAASLFKQASTRVGTGELNTVVSDIIGENAPRPKRGTGRLKVLYATQVSTAPPTLVVFVNHPDRVSTTFERFLLNGLRDRLPFSEVPIRLVFRGRRAMASAKEAS